MRNSTLKKCADAQNLCQRAAVKYEGRDEGRGGVERDMVGSAMSRFKTKTRIGEAFRLHAAFVQLRDRGGRCVPDKLISMLSCYKFGGIRRIDRNIGGSGGKTN